MTDKIDTLEKLAAERLDKLELATNELGEARRVLREKYNTYNVALSQYNTTLYALEKAKDALDSAE